MGLALRLKKYLLSKYQNTEYAGAFSGVDKFYRSIRKDGKYSVSRNQIKQFLQSQEYYTLQKQVNRKFRRNKAITPYAGYQIDLDTAYLKQYAQHNDGFKFILAGIDCFSKVAHAIPLKTLSSKEVAGNIEKLLNKFDKIENIRMDNGTEMKNTLVTNIFKKRNINFFYTNNSDIKAHFVERFFKSFKSKLFRYMQSQNTHRWIDKLEYLINSYNSSYHNTIKQSPSSVTKDDEYRIWKLLYEQNNLPKPVYGFRFKLHDTVRICVIKSSFQRVFDDLWSREYFIIADRMNKDRTPVYILKDIKNELIKGKFYENELQKIDVTNADQSYIIEKVIQKKNGKSLVKWLGWESKFSSWIPNSELESFN